MSRFFMKFSLAVIGSVLFLGACSGPEAVDTYTTHIEAVYNLVTAHAHNTDLAGEAVLAYVRENRAEIEASLAELGTMDEKQVEQHYGAVMKPVNALRDALQGETVVYPDSIRDQILGILAENKQTLDERAATAAEAAGATVIEQNFALFTVELGIIKELVKSAPLVNYHLNRNPNFSEALQILKIDNLISS